jgi:hypothetical protein
LAAVVGRRLKEAGDDGKCNLDAGLCPASCKTKATEFVDDYDCCIERFVEVEEATQSANPVWRKIIDFVEGKCEVTVPDACQGASKEIAAQLVIRNLKFAAWYLLQKEKQAKILAKIALDIARELGVRENAVTCNKGEETIQAVVGHNGIVTYATDPNSVTVSVTIKDDNDAALNAANTQLSAGITDSTLSFAQLNNPKGEAGVTVRSDPTDGFSVDPAKSKAVVQTPQPDASSTGADGDDKKGGSGASKAAVGVSVLALTAAAVLLA